MGRYATQISHQSMHVVRRKIAEAIVGSFAHRARRAPMSIGMTGGKIEIHILVAPIADAGILVASDVVGAPTRGEGARKFSVIVQRIGEVARCMALTTMAHRLSNV